MNDIQALGFYELSEADMYDIDGGFDPWTAACAIVTLVVGALVGGFNAGRAFVRDIRGN